MQELFRGWKRKAGVITLLSACVFAVGWVRSQTLLDVMTFPVQTYQTGKRFAVNIDTLASQEGAICWERFHQERDEDDEDNNPYPVWHTSAEMTSYDDPQFKLKIRWQRFGFAVREYPQFEQDWDIYVFIPYWSIVLPLTALSAWLLLSKPRKTRTPTRELESS